MKERKNEKSIGMLCDLILNKITPGRGKTGVTN